MCCCTIKRFCWIRLWGEIIGWASGLISVVQIIICIVILANLDNILKPYPVHSYGIHDIHTFELISIGISVALSVHLGACIIDLLASTMMIIGIKRNSHLMLLPWLVNNIFSLVFLIPSNFVFMWAVVENSGPVELPILIFVILGMHCWAWIVICSLFRSIRDNKAEEDVETPDYKQLHNSELVSDSRY